MTELERLERLIQQQERTVRAALRAFIASATSESVMRQVRVALEQRRVTEALRIVDTHLLRLGTVLPRIFAEAGVAEADALAVKLPAQSGIALSFDPAAPIAAELMRRNQLQFILDMTTRQRGAIRRALAMALEVGSGIRVMARAFRDAIGLTDRQVTAVGRYRRSLEEVTRDALDRTLRDRRFDRSVRRAVERGEPLTAKQIQLMTERYNARMLQRRAETIARTETQRTVSLARQEALRQTLSQLGLTPNDVARTWHSTKDERVRDTHEAMDGQTVMGLNARFTSPSGAKLLYPGDPAAPAEEVINCRCVVTHRILSPKERQQRRRR